tara:strand:- start:638 stop:772 length:135 start_codon:yes stop_codon:yes gene_type:complete
MLGPLPTVPMDFLMPFHATQYYLIWLVVSLALDVELPHRLHGMN